MVHRCNRGRYFPYVGGSEESINCLRCQEILAQGRSVCVCVCVCTCVCEQVFSRTMKAVNMKRWDMDNYHGSSIQQHSRAFSGRLADPVVCIN